MSCHCIFLPPGRRIASFEEKTYCRRLSDERPAVESAYTRQGCPFCGQRRTLWSSGWQCRKPSLRSRNVRANGYAFRFASLWVEVAHAEAARGNGRTE
jgi:hypothetical protein